MTDISIRVLRYPMPYDAVRESIIRRFRRRDRSHHGDQKTRTRRIVISPPVLLRVRTTGHVAGMRGASHSFSSFIRGKAASHPAPQGPSGGRRSPQESEEMTTIVAEQPEGWKGIEKRMTDDELEQLVAGMAEEFGFGTSDAAFAEFEDFKVKWTRSFGWILLQVSDYIANAPEEIVEVLMRTVFRRITGEQIPYPKELRDWITSERFLNGNRPTYLERHTEFSQVMAEKNRDLAESYGRLVSRGLLERDPGLVIGWADMARSRRIGTASTVMRTAMVSRRLDSEMVDDEAFDYALYNLVCQAESGLTDENMSRKERIETRLAEYPEKERAESCLERLRFEL